jgi:hypothetical protein
MELSSQIVPAIVVLVANLLSGRHASLRWETVTAIFGWGAAFSIVALVIASIFAPDSVIREYLVQIAAFCLLTALSRDYERILRPLFPWNR